MKKKDKVRVKQIYTLVADQFDPWAQAHMDRATGGLEGTLIEKREGKVWKVQFKNTWFHVHESDMEVIREPK